MKPTDYYQKREQTYLKHLFLEQYLETVAYHIGYYHREFAYVDCFAGPWQAADMELGDTSVRIALERLNQVQVGLVKHLKRPIIRAIFVEKSQKAFKKLRSMIEQHSGTVRTTAFQGTFEDNIGNIVKELGTTFAFVFVDPTGWTGFAMDSLPPILKRPYGEVVINFMYDFVNRFLTHDTPSNEESLDRLFGTREWRTIRTARNRESEMVELYKKQVRSTGGFEYVTSTRILKPLSNRAYFHLVYATNSREGIVEFRKVERKVVAMQSEIRARIQRENREERTGQSEFRFEADRPPIEAVDEQGQQLQKAEALLREILQKGKVRFGQLQPRILELPLVCATDLNKIIANGRKRGWLAVEGLGHGERVPKPEHFVRMLDPK